MDTTTLVAVALAAAVGGAILGAVARSMWASQGMKAAKAEARRIEAEARARQVAQDLGAGAGVGAGINLPRTPFCPSRVFCRTPAQPCITGPSACCIFACTPTRTAGASSR